MDARDFYSVYPLTMLETEIDKEKGASLGAEIDLKCYRVLLLSSH